MYEQIVNAAKVAGPAAKDIIKKNAPIVAKFAKEKAPIIATFAKEKAPIAVEFVKDKSPEIIAGIQIIAKPARKGIRKLRRINDLGDKMPKYDLDRLTKLFIDKRIIPEMYRYLSNEFTQYEDVIKQHPRNFDKLFETLIKVKDMKEGASIIERYETAREEYLKSVRKGMESNLDNSKETIYETSN